MKSLGANLGIAVCGLVTSVLVAILNVVISNVVGINIFTFNIWFIVPAGAVAVGMAAASGYYFGALYFHKRPTPILFIQMALIAAFSQFLIYYLEYATLVIDGQRISEYVQFSQYLDISLTKAHYRVGRGAGVDTGEIGSTGYWIAGLQFVGFLVGGIAIYFILSGKAVCEECQMYFRPLAKKVKTFEDTDACSQYYDVLFTHPVDSEDFAALVRSEAKVAKVEQGTIQVNTVLNGCPGCKSQLVIDEVSVNNGREWKEISDLKRQVSIPNGIDLKPIFKA